jgi:excinuclease ABC subunit A
MVAVEMQFLADLPMVCPECQGTRYRREILTARYRGLNIGEVLNLTVAEALPFFRTLPKIRKRLQVLKDVGLDYLPLGQPTVMLSGGESQRLKLAGFLSESRRAHTLFLFDEPTSGLHPTDVQTLLNCFDHLLSVGHSVIVAEHNLHLIRQADWVIDLGPGPGADGGTILAEGSPDEIADNKNSLTGQCLSPKPQRN